MIINEQALLRVMKDAYKGQGFHVAAFYANGREHVLFYGLGWLVMMERKNAPGKVWGYVCEKVGEWPKEDEAYLVRKGEVQTEQHDIAMDRLDMYREMFERHPVEQIMPTQLLMGQTELWQCCAGLDMVLMDPELTDIIGDSRVSVLRAGTVLEAEGSLSAIYISSVSENETTKPILEHLKKLRWVSEK